jgi:glyoxylase-like metal-dependent hydrolase (beta-lactamase superfamily II)
MTHIEIAEGLHVVIGGHFPKCNSLVIVDDEVVVIDPGCGIEDLRAFLMTQNRALSDIGTVILSHIHPDHITHAVRLNRLSRCRIAANEITTPLFNDKEKMKTFLGFHRANPVRPLWEKLVNSKMFGALEEGRIDEELQNGDKFSLGSYTLRMLYTPGHLPDHMCIEILEPNLIFGADIDLDLEFGPFYGHPNSSIPEFKDSIRRIQHNNYGGLISGHLQKPLIEDYKTVLSAYQRHIGMREDLVLSEIMGGAGTIAEITLKAIIYPSLTDPVFLQFETWMIEHHVASLLQRGLIEEKKGRYVFL